MACSTFIQDETTYEFIVEKDEMEGVWREPQCVQRIDEQYAVWYYDGRTLPPLSVQQYSYGAIPKVFWLMDTTYLEVSGILSLQNQPTLALKGEGVIIGIIDTGIDYQDALFQNPDGSSRILSIWDQTGEAQIDTQTVGNSIFQYGAIYEREQIEEALNSENPVGVVPVTDEIGHGTSLAKIAAGSEDFENDFVGAAPRAELAVVKLKPAKQNVREFFFLPEREPLYMESDIMAGVAYLDAVADREKKPLVILIGLGTNQGSHIGTDFLSSYLSDVGAKRGRAVVVAAGNQAISQHHFYGMATSLLQPVSVEINVEEGVEGYCMELWAYAPEQLRVVVQSPTGQRSQGGFPLSQETQNTSFIFENTTLTIDYRVVGQQSSDLLIFFRFTRPTQGIWTVLVYPQNVITGSFHMWLPIQPLVGNDVTFIEPNPDTTITTPGTATAAITVGGYNGLTGAEFLESGRGYDGLGRVKPDFNAPAVDVLGVTGTSAAAAITAGAAALVLQWGIGKGNAPGMNSNQVKNFLIRGATRRENLEYPNRQWGYGTLDVYQSFQILRES